MPKKIFKGKVVSTKMQQTVVVAVDVLKAHPVYKKKVKSTKRYKARDEIGTKMGDTVTIEETRPYAKEVYFRVVEVEGSDKGSK